MNIREIDLNQPCRIVIGSSRDLIELQRVVVDYNDVMHKSDRVEIVVDIDNEGVERAILTGSALSLFQIGIRYGRAEERKYLKSLEPVVREIIL